jgi:hypothetical protein
VVPIIVGSAPWQDGSLGQLQALPSDGKPIRRASRRSLDEAFFEIAKGIRCVIEEVKKQPPALPLLHQRSEKGEKNLQKASVLEQKPLPEEPLATHEADPRPTRMPSSKGVSRTYISRPSRFIEDTFFLFGERISRLQSQNLWKRRPLVAVVIFFILAGFLVPFRSLLVCPIVLCHSSQNGETVQDQNLSMDLVAVASPSFVLSDDSKQDSNANALSTSISAVSLAKYTSTYDDIVINVQNVQYEGADILIDAIALKLLSIPALPNPLKVWTPGATKYFGYPYPVTYEGQTADQLLYATSSQNVILAPRETDSLLIEMMSTETAYLQFQVQITYQITGAPQTLILPQTFQAAFSDASNWQEYILQNGSFIKKHERRYIHQ